MEGERATVVAVDVLELLQRRLLDLSSEMKLGRGRLKIRATSRGRLDHLQARGAGEFLLPPVEADKPPQPQFERTGHMQDVQRARAQGPGMLSRQLAGSPQSRTPQQICLPVAPAFKKSYHTPASVRLRLVKWGGQRDSNHIRRTHTKSLEKAASSDCGVAPTTEHKERWARNVGATASGYGA